MNQQISPNMQKPPSISTNQLRSTNNSNIVINREIIQSTQKNSTPNAANPLEANKPKPTMNEQINPYAQTTQTIPLDMNSEIPSLVTVLTYLILKNS